MMKALFRAVPAAFLCAAVLLPPLSAAGAAPPFAGLHTIDAHTPQGLQDLFAPGGGVLPLVSAHRGGAAPSFPENCIATFEETLRHCWSMLEIDPRYTKDHVLVLNHDPTLERTTSGTGRIADHTLAELKQLRLKDPEGHLTEYRMPTLDETLEWARNKTILVLDKKDVPIPDLIRKIEEHHAEAYCLVIAYSLADIAQCHALDKDIMMEIMVGNHAQLEAFDRTGVPWRNVIAFVGHTPPTDSGLCARIHTKGASCMAGTSRNLDCRFLERQAPQMESLEADYRALLDMGIDILETDIPREVAPLLYAQEPIPASKAKYFRHRTSPNHERSRL